MIFKVFKERKSKTNLNSPIPLPELEEEKNKPNEIFSHLENGDVIWAWHRLSDRVDGLPNPIPLESLTYNFGSFCVYRKENDFLLRYNVELSKEKEIFLRLYKVFKFNYSEIIKVYEEEFIYAYKLFLDSDSAYTSNCQAYLHDLTVEKILDLFTTQNVILITKDHFFKKDDYPNGLPANYLEIKK